MNFEKGRLNVFTIIAHIRPSLYRDVAKARASDQQILLPRREFIIDWSFKNN